MPEKQRDAQWSEIFNTYDVVNKVQERGKALITSSQINVLSRGIQAFAARNMCKIDSQRELPTVMAQNGLALLAISDGKYRIGRFNPFLQIPPPLPTTCRIEKPAPEGFVSLSARAKGGESLALDTALYSGMLRDVFGEEVFLTVRGRRRESGSHFVFDVSGEHFDVNGVQIEVDGGYEGLGGLHIVEAKIGDPGSVSIRQVLYPLLYWREKAAQAASRMQLAEPKPVASYVFLYDEPMYRFIPIAWDGQVASLDLSAERIFTLSDSRPFDLSSVTPDQGRTKINHKSPFPQADSLDKLLTTLILVGCCEVQTKRELVDQMGITMRQINYYVGVLFWMKLGKMVKVTGRGKVIELTRKGRHLCKVSRVELLQQVFNIMFSDPVANRALHGEDIGSGDVSFPRYWRKLSPRTRSRRAGCIRRWIEYFREVDAQQTPHAAVAHELPHT